MWVTLISIWVLLHYMGQLKANADDDFIARVDAEAERLDISRAEYVRSAVREKLPDEKENGVPVKYRRYDWSEYRDAARTIDSYEDLQEAMPERLAYPFGNDLINEIPEIDGAKDAPLRHIIIRGILDGVQESRAQSEKVEDTGEYTNTFIESIYDRMGVSDTTRWRDIQKGELMERGVAYPLPAADPKFSRDKLYDQLIHGKQDGINGQVPSKRVLREYYPFPEAFFEDLGAQIVPSTDAWVRSEGEYIGALERHTQTISENIDAIANSNSTTFAAALMEFWAEYLQERGVITDVMVEMIPGLEKYR
jgi:hypothetical protein